MESKVPVPPGSRVFERNGLPVVWPPDGPPRSAVTGVVLESPEELGEVGRAEFDRLLEGWPSPDRRPAT